MIDKIKENLEIQLKHVVGVRYDRDKETEGGQDRD